MQGIKVARVEEITRSAYPSTAACRLGIFQILLGLGGIACAIASNYYITMDFDGAKEPFLYGGLAMGASALLVGIIAVVSGKPKTGCCLLVFLSIFTIIAMLIAGGMAVYSGILLKSLQEREEFGHYKIAKLTIDKFLPDNPISKELDGVNIFCMVFLVLSCLEAFFALISTCFTCKGICCSCCSSDPPYNRILYQYPTQPEIVISTGNPLSAPPVYDE